MMISHLVLITNNFGLRYKTHIRNDTDFFNVSCDFSETNILAHLNEEKRK